MTDKELSLFMVLNGIAAFKHYRYVTPKGVVTYWLHKRVLHHLYIEAHHRRYTVMEPEAIHAKLIKLLQESDDV